MWVNAPYQYADKNSRIQDPMILQTWTKSCRSIKVRFSYSFLYTDFLWTFFPPDFVGLDI